MARATIWVSSRKPLIGPLNGLSSSTMTMAITATGVTTGRKISVRNSVESFSSLLLRMMAKTRLSSICSGTVIAMK